MNAVEIKNLSKNFGPKQAVCGLNMTVPMGAIYGFIGENGSGKSTTEKMICGLIPTSGGSIKSNQPSFCLCVDADPRSNDADNLWSWHHGCDYQENLSWLHRWCNLGFCCGDGHLYD